MVKEHNKAVKPTAAITEQFLFALYQYSGSCYANKCGPDRWDNECDSTKETFNLFY